MKKYFLTPLKAALAVALTAVFAGAAGGAEAPSLKWVGCGISNKAFMGALSNAYQQKTGTLIELEGGGATRGIRDVSAGAADLGGSCRHRILAHEESNTKLIPVGWDAIVVITHPSNPVKNISSEQLKAVMSGQMTNWSELGGPDAPIKLAVREGKISGVGLMARELLFFDPEYEFSANAKQLRSSGPVEQFVESDPMAIALTGISSGRKRDVNFLSLNGVEPTYENLAEGGYVLYRPLYLVIAKEPSAAVREFVAFASGPEGQQVIKSQGTVNMRDGSQLWAGYRQKMKQARQTGQF